ncbi:MAG TPA: inosine/xanthosine triphosphatase [Candidatus Limnocylindria bacterium]|nr:inosine/xanthosine triphosphatase [Candidatus Limnocylindria bacterium]
MKVCVGSKNETKVKAVADTIKNYPLFKDAEVKSVDVNVETFGHPKGFEEINQGAMDRAKAAFDEGCDFSFGIESGLIAVPKTKTGYMEVAACAIYDGKNYHLGLSPAFEWPKAVADGIVNKGLDGSQAFKAAGLTNDEKIGASHGAIHFLSDGKLNRTEYNKWAVMMALVHLEKPELYK